MSGARFVFENGSFNSRRIPRADAGVVALETVARLEGYVPPSGTKAIFNTILDELKELNAEMLTHIQVERFSSDAVEVPEALRLLEAEETLRSNFLLNTALDRRYRRLTMFLRAHIEVLSGTPQSDAATQVLDAIGEDEDFLKAPSKRQFWEMTARLKRLDGLSAEVGALGLSDPVKALTSLNTYFGQLLGVTAAEAQNEEVIDPVGPLVTRLEVLMVRLTAFMHVAHPTPEDAQTVNGVLAPYLEAISSKTRKTQKNPEPAPQPPVSPDSPLADDTRV